MIEEIDSSKLNLMNGEYGVWFRSGEGLDFSAIFNAHDITYFEINSHGVHLSGGIERPLRFGRVKKEHGERSVGFKRSDLIEYEDQIPQEGLDEAIDFISQCQFESKIKEGILDFLSSRGRVKTGLHSDIAYESFLKGERERKVPHIDRHYRKRFVSILLTCLFMGLVIWTYSLLNISYYEQRCQEGDVTSCQRLMVIETIRGNRERVLALEELEKNALSQGDLAQLKSQCDSEDFEACLSLYEAGDSTLGETRLLEWACTGANDKYCLNHAIKYLKNKELPIDSDSMSKVRTLLSNSKNFKKLLVDIETAVGERECGSADECFKMAQNLDLHNVSFLAYFLYKRSCDYGGTSACDTFAEMADRRGESEKAQEVFRTRCQQTKNPDSCFRAAFAKFTDAEDRKALRDAFDRCKHGAENYCMFLYDRVK